MFTGYVIGVPADQGSPTAFTTDKLFSSQPSLLYYLTAMNKSAGDLVIELYDIATAYTGTPILIPRILLCPTNATVGWMNYRMRNGIYVRAVDAVAGSLIGTNDVQFDCGYSSPWPNAV